jgi:hypothetical protein
VKTQNIALDICMKQRYANLLYEYAGYHYYAYLIDRYNRLVFDYYQLQSENQRLLAEIQRLQTQTRESVADESSDSVSVSKIVHSLPNDIPSDIFQHQSEVIQQLREGGYLQKKRDKKSVQMCFSPIAETDENTP